MPMFVAVRVMMVVAMRVMVVVAMMMAVSAQRPEHPHG